ncbi:hypothetical protein J6590_005938 [Homalodisca vitripennis]|nr:hypothetical protein J6590_005938 [Homalodisca vitripennis]
MELGYCNYCATKATITAVHTGQHVMSARLLGKCPHTSSSGKRSEARYYRGLYRRARTSRHGTCYTMVKGVTEAVCQGSPEFQDSILSRGYKL